MNFRLSILSRNIFKSLSFNELTNNYFWFFTTTVIISIFFLVLFVVNFKNNIRSIKTVNFMNLSVFFVLFSLVLLVNEKELYNNNFVSLCNTIVMMFYFPIFIVLMFLLFTNIIQIFKNGFSRMNKVNILAILIFITTEYLLYNMALGEDTFIFILLGELIGGIALYFISIFIGTVISTIVFLIVRPKYDKDFIVILGCRCTKDNKPSELLKNRIDSAINFYKQQIIKTGKKATFIVTGTVSTAGCLSEAEIMSNYLRENGIQDKNIILEKKAKNTFQNMKYCKNIIKKINKKAKCVFVTNDFHIFRSSIFADINELHCQSLNSGTINWCYSFNRFLLEFKGVFDTYKKYHIYICSGIAVLSIVTSFIYKINLSTIIQN